MVIDITVPLYQDLHELREQGWSVMSEMIRLSGITKLDRLELDGVEGVQFEETKIDADAHGEVTLFTAMIAMAAVSALAAYLLRKHNMEDFEEEVEIVHSDGRVEKRRIKWTKSSTEAPEADIIRQIRGGGARTA